MHHNDYYHLHELTKILGVSKNTLYKLMKYRNFPPCLVINRTCKLVLRTDAHGFAEWWEVQRQIKRQENSQILDTLLATLD